MDGSFHTYKHRVELLILYLSIQLMTALTAEIYGGSCPEGQPVVPLNLTDGEASSIFDDLTAQEIMNVIKYMKQIECFNIKDFDSVTINSTYIALVELMPPTKADALLYLEKRGPEPGRYAKVILYRGDADEPVIEEYKVGPLPNPTLNTQIIHAHWRQPIPYSLRSPTADGDLVPWKEFICGEMAKVKDLLMQVTGYSYSWNCKDQCLTYVVFHPGHPTRSVRSMWINVYRRLKHFPLKPIGLQFRVNLNTTSSCNWNVDFVWFRNKSFNNMEHLRDSVSESDFKSVPTTATSLPDDSVTEYPMPNSSKTEEELPPRQHGPRSYMPDGRRFSVVGRKVNWFGWSFHFNIRSTTGLQLHDIRFDNQRIVYELSLQEIVSLYSGASPATFSSVSMESVNFLGTISHELYPGIDCPEDASYFDSVHYVHFRPKRYRNTVCLFERNEGVFMKRQNGQDNHFSLPSEQLSAHTLVLRTVIVTDWYDYILDFIFHPNAVLEVVFSISGSSQPTFYTQPEHDKFGFELFSESTANIHNHLINFKVDLDINGHVNRFDTLDSEKDSSRVGLGENGTSENSFYMHYFKRKMWSKESSATQTYSSAASNYYLFYHVNNTNANGKPRSYRLVPLTVSKLMLPGDKLISKSITWADNQVVVTKRKDDEDTSSTVYNAMDMINPVLNFYSYIGDDESIVDEDLTAWVTLGSMHIPHTEDFPIVETPGSQLSFILQPFDYFDPDPPLSAPSIQPVERMMRQETKKNPSRQRARDYDCRPVLVKSSIGSRLGQKSVFWHICWSFLLPLASACMSLLQLT